MTGSLSTYRELAVLAAVRDHAAHGYAIAAGFAAACGMGVALKRPNTYALLERLEQRGLVERLPDPDDARSSAGTRRITDAGRRALADLARSAFPAVPDPVLPAVTLLMAANDLAADERSSLLDEAIAAVDAKLAQVAELDQHADDEHGPVALLRRHLELDRSALAAARN